MATVAAPIDATSTAAWKALEAHQEKLEAEGIDLKAWFAADAGRVNKLSFDAGDLHFDLSKNLVTDETVKLLCDLAREVKLEERRDAMFSGEHINTTEDRAVLHTALRRPASEKGQLIVDGQDVVADVHEVLDRMYVFAERVRSGEWKGVTGKKIEHLVSIGIGGSDLGPVMAYEALRPYADAGIDCRYISNIDPNDQAEKLRGLDPETTLVIIVSKTFTTLETLTNAREVKTWMLERLRFLELGRWPLLRRLRRGPVADRRARPRALPAVPRGLPCHRRVLLQHAAREQRRRADGPAQRLVRQLLRFQEPRRASVLPVSAPLPGLPAAAHHGVQRQARPLGRQRCDLRYR